jgi:hypothetical protein
MKYMFVKWKIGRDKATTETGQQKDQCYLSEQIKEINFTVTNQGILGKPISLQNCEKKKH